MKNHKF